MRKFAWIGLLPLLGVAYAQEAKVTYTTVAVSAKKAIADLAAKSGVKMECSTSMESEILILRLQDAPIDQVMSQIATVTSGTWTKQGETFYLVANGSARTNEANKIHQRYADKIGVTLKKFADALAPKPTNPKNPKDTKSGTNPQTMNPDDTLAMIGMGNPSMVKLAIAIGANQLASVQEGGRVVFSTNPTRAQVALPSSANQIIADYVVEHNKQAAAVKQDEPAKAEQDPNVAAFMELISSRVKKPVAITAPPAKAIVVASRRGMFMGYSLQLKLYDANGKTLASDSLPLSLDMPFDAQAILNPKAPPANEGAEIKLSPVAAEFYKAGNSFAGMRSGGAATLKFSDALMAQLKDPVEHDPLSYMHSEALIAVAKERNEQLVADLPDAVTSFFDNLVEKGKLTTGSFMREIKGEDKAQVAEQGGWLAVMPDNPVKSRKDRLDRVALRTLIQASQSQGYVGLDNLASYAKRNGSPLEIPASMTYVMLFAPNAMQQGMMGIVNWDMLRLYGMMDMNQRDLLRQGRRVSFSQLTPEEQAQLTKMLFGADEVLNAENQQSGAQPKKQDPLTEMIFSQIERFGGGSENDYRTEPTEIMPNGLPTDGYVTLNANTETVAQPQTMSTDFGRGTSMGPMELGLLKFFKEDPNMSQISGAIPTVDDLKMGTRTVYNFSFYVAPFVSQKQTLNDDNIPKDAPVYKMTNLPSDFQKQINDMAASMGKNPLWKMIGQMGGFGQRAVPPQ